VTVTIAMLKRGPALCPLAGATAVVMLSAGVALAQEEKEDWQPDPPLPGKSDWI
jgi:hypothetical protein